MDEEVRPADRQTAEEAPAGAIAALASRRDGLLDWQRMYLWRAVDDEGEVLDLVVQRRRDNDAALKLLARLLRNQPVEPESITTDYQSPFPSSLPRRSGRRLGGGGRLIRKRLDELHPQAVC